MKKKLLWLVVALALWPVGPASTSGQEQLPGNHARNIVIFVFDGLRAGSVNSDDSHNMFWIRNHGVSFSHIHSIFTNFTNANS